VFVREWVKGRGIKKERDDARKGSVDESASV
jgi:hypothetical protein